MRPPGSLGHLIGESPYSLTGRVINDKLRVKGPTEWQTSPTQVYDQGYGKRLLLRVTTGLLLFTTTPLGFSRGGAKRDSAAIPLQ